MPLRAPGSARLILCFLAAAAIVPIHAAAQQSFVVPMTALNGSGENGTATLTAKGNTTLVTIRLRGGSDIEQPAHIHSGSCQTYVPRPLYPLNDVIDGKSTTVIAVPIAKLIAGNLIVNVHKSYADIADQASCGSIPS